MSGEIRPRPLFVSRMPRRKVTGKVNDATIKSPRALKEGYLIGKKALCDLELDDNGEIKGYYNREDDRLLYEALKAQLKKYGGDAKKAFTEDFHKPKHDGTPGPIVKKVKVYEKSTINVSVLNGLGAANNGEMVRVDVFHVNGDGYYFVPIYVADTLKPELPDKACVKTGKWKQMKPEDFVFTLYPNDLFRVKSKKGVILHLANKQSTLPENIKTVDTFLYYINAGIKSVSLTCRNHDNTYIKESLGVKNLEKMEKYTVDILGEAHKVEKEKRMPFTRKGK